MVVIGITRCRDAGYRPAGLMSRDLG